MSSRLPLLAPVKHVVSSRVVYAYPANKRRCLNVVLMLGRHRRRWPYIKTTLGQCLVLAGYLHLGMHRCAVILHANT